jgi:hypothetical protein
LAYLKSRVLTTQTWFFLSGAARSINDNTEESELASHSSAVGQGLGFAIAPGCIRRHGP